MKVSLFDYELPPERIAQVPAEPRDASRLMVLDRLTGRIEHRHFFDIAEYLRPGDLLVMNDTRVIPSRVYGIRRTMGKVEVVFLRERADGLWEALIGSGGHVMPGEALKLAEGSIEVEVTAKDEEGVFTLKVIRPDDLMGALESFGHMPVPPYIARKGKAAALEGLDRTRYQTVYAEKSGAVAAPTAGLHFTEALLAHLTESGIRIAKVTLHVGLGTFRPVKVDTVEDHVMHKEYFEVGPKAAEAIESARRERRRLVAVGTTTTRTLESLPEGRVEPARGHTDLFIHPPYRFRRVDQMVTNFHLPRSTLLMMVSAFAERKRILAAYEEAKREGYRFYSYGDAMLIL
ncbi:MAG: tRNA preQ1(34) S-adenosylmethionine ribosyltransferase-isomerase QueA [Planctomycetes bacterium]|nr:tRNA preQ1(34) S-adenosylmethionine ribosyltransferase-isomerase QueA [Planctomycetota bacterium]